MSTKEELYIAQRVWWQGENQKLIGLIELHKGEVKLLERRIESDRPRTEDGEKVCPGCDCFSMVPISREPENWSCKEKPIVSEYICKICGYSGEFKGLT